MRPTSNRANFSGNGTKATLLLLFWNKKLLPKQSCPGIPLQAV